MYLVLAGGTTPTKASCSQKNWELSGMYLFRLFTVSLLLLHMFGCNAIVSGVNDSSSFIEPMVERRDTLTATGYAVIDVQPSDNSAQRRLLAIRAAKLDAYRGLTEQVYGQYLDATTTVSDMAIRSDSFRARVEGVVYGANLVRIEPRGSDTYEVTMSLDKSIVNDLRVLYLERAFRASSASTGS